MPKKEHFENVLTKQHRIAEIAGKYPEKAMLSLAHQIDLEWLYVAYLWTRKDGAVGVDGRSASDYEKNLSENLKNLLERLKSGNYKAPAVRRVRIPKGNGDTRPLGIPTFEDKILQRSVLMAINPVFEHDFYDFSFGFREGRSAHKALRYLRDGITKLKGGWVIDLDIHKYFDSIDHSLLRDIYKQRIADGTLRRILGKWLKAGVMEKGQLSFSDSGTPQGGVISPLLSNIFLHEVLDDWFVKVVRPVLKGCAFMVRYADDAVLVFEHEIDARRVMAVLPKRFSKYGLELHPEKTQLVRFKTGSTGDCKPGTFDFLGFTLYWGKSRQGRSIIKWKTSNSRLSRASKRIYDWCKKVRHWKLKDQHRILCQKIKGHYAYYGMTFNSRSLNVFLYWCERHWHKWLSRRSDKSYINWNRFSNLLKHYPLPSPRIIHSL